MELGHLLLDTLRPQSTCKMLLHTLICKHSKTSARTQTTPPTTYPHITHTHNTPRHMLSTLWLWLPKNAVISNLMKGLRMVPKRRWKKKLFPTCLWKWIKNHSQGWSYDLQKSLSLSLVVSHVCLQHNRAIMDVCSSLMVELWANFESALQYISKFFGAKLWTGPSYCVDIHACGHHDDSINAQSVPDTYMLPIRRITLWLQSIIL